MHVNKYNKVMVLPISEYIDFRRNRDSRYIGEEADVSPAHEASAASFWPFGFHSSSPSVRN